MSDNEDKKPEVPENGKDALADDSPSKSPREPLGKSKSLPDLEYSSGRNNTRISQSESSFIASLKQRSIEPEEHEVRRFGEVKLVRTLSQLVGSEHSFVEEEGDAGEQPEQTPVGDTMSYMDFPSTIGTDTKLDAELRPPLRSVETVGEGKMDERLHSARLQGEATVAPTTLESSVGEPRIAKVPSDLETYKKPTSAGTEEVTAYTSFSDSIVPRQDAESIGAPIHGEGGEDETARPAAGTSRAEVTRPAEEDTQRPVPFKTPEETTAGSEVEDTLVERAGFGKQIEEPASKTMTRADAIEPRGDWEGPAGEKPAEETTLAKQPPKRRVSTQVSESQASEWRIVERLPPSDETEAAPIYERKEEISGEQQTYEEQPIRTPVKREDEALLSRDADQATGTVLQLAMEIDIDVSGTETAEKIEKTAVESTLREHPAAAIEERTIEEYKDKPIEIEISTAERPTYGETSPLTEFYPQEAPPVPSYVEVTPYIEPCTRDSDAKAARSLTMTVLPEKENTLEGLLTAKPVAPPPDALKKRRRSSIMPPTAALVPWYKGKPEALEAVDTAEAAVVQEPSYAETTPAMESYPEEAPTVPSYIETTPYIETCAPESGVKAARSLTMILLPEKEKALEELPKAESLAPSPEAMKKRRRSSIMPPTSALVPGYRGKSEAIEAVETAEAAAVQEPSYAETTPAMESYPQEVPPVPSYVETTPYIETYALESGVKGARSLTMILLPEKEKALEELPKAESLVPSPEALKKRRRSSIMPPTSALVPGYRGKSEAIEAVETAEAAAVQEPSYAETTPAMESYPQEVPPVPSYVETTPYIETYALESGVKGARSLTMILLPEKEKALEELPKAESLVPSPEALKKRRRSSIMPPTSALVPGYRGKSEAIEAVETAEAAAVQEPSYAETTPAMESYPQEVPPVPSYVETTPYIETYALESGVKGARSLTMILLPEKEKALEELPKAESLVPSPEALKKRRRSSIMPPTSALVPGYRGKSEAIEAVETAEAAAVQEPSYAETTPAMESYPQEVPPVPSYVETTPYMETYAPESGVKAARSLTMMLLPEKEKALEELSKAESLAPSPEALKKRRRSSIMPPTSALVPGYRGKSEALEAVATTEAATIQEPSYAETTPAMEIYPQEAPPVPSYIETTPYIETCAPESGVKAARSLTMILLPEKEKALEELPKAESPAPSPEALKKRRRSSIIPPTAALVPWYHGKSEALEAVATAETTAVQEPSYAETTPAMESYPQEAPPVPSYIETTPYIETRAPESGVKAARSLTMMLLPEKEKALEELPKAESPAPSPEALKKRRRSSIMPPTAALVPWYHGKSEVLEAVATAEAAAVQAPSYAETTPAMESYPQEAPPVPSYIETTPYIETCAPESGVKAARSLTMMLLPEKEKALEELPKAESLAPSPEALKKRRRSSIMPPTSAIVPGYRGKSEALDAVATAEAAAVQEPSYAETTPAMESYPQEVPPVPSYVETTPYMETYAPESGVKAARSLTMMLLPEKEKALEELSKAESLAPSSEALKKRRRSSIMPPTSALVPGYRGKSEALEAVETSEPKAAVEPSYEETTPAIYPFPQESTPLPSYAESVAYTEARFSESSLTGPHELQAPTQAAESPTSDVRMERAVVEVMSFSIEELSPGEMKPLAGVDQAETESRVVPAFTSEEPREVAVHETSMVAIAAPEKPDGGGLFGHTSFPSTPKKHSRHYSDFFGVLKPEMTPPHDGQAVTATVTDFDAEAANEEQGSSLGTQSSQEDEEVKKMSKKDKVALALYDDNAAKAALQAKQREQERQAKEQVITLSATLTPEVKESQPFVLGSAESASLIEAAQTASHISDKVVAESVLKAEVPPGGELGALVQAGVSDETALQEWKPAPIDIVPDIRQLIEEKLPAPSEIIKAEMFEQEKEKPESVPGPPDQGVPVTVLKPSHDIPLRVFAGKPVVTEPLTSAPAGATERMIHVSAPWAAGLSTAKAAESARGRLEWEKELGRVTGKDRRIERLHEKKTAKYSVLLKDGLPVTSFSSSSEVTEPVKDECADGLAYQYVASEEQVLERIVTLDGPSPTAAEPDETDGRPPGADSNGLVSDDHSMATHVDRPSPKQADEPQSETTPPESKTSPKEATLYAQHPTEHTAGPSEVAAPDTKRGSDFETRVRDHQQTEPFVVKRHLAKEEQHTERATGTGSEEVIADRERKLPDLTTSGEESPSALYISKHLKHAEKIPSTSDTPVHFTEAVSAPPTMFAQAEDNTSRQAPDIAPAKAQESKGIFEENVDIPATERPSQAPFKIAESSNVTEEEKKQEKLDSGAERLMVEYSDVETSKHLQPSESVPAGAAAITMTRIETRKHEGSPNIGYHAAVLASACGQEVPADVASEMVLQGGEVPTVAVLGSKTLGTTPVDVDEQDYKRTFLDEPKVSELKAKEALVEHSSEPVTEPALHMSLVARPETALGTVAGTLNRADIIVKSAGQYPPKLDQKFLQKVPAHPVSNADHPEDTKQKGALSDAVAVSPVTEAVRPLEQIPVQEQLPLQTTQQHAEKSLAELQRPGAVIVPTQAVVQINAQELASDMLEVLPEAATMVPKADQNMAPGSTVDFLERPVTEKTTTQDISLAFASLPEQQTTEQLEVAIPSGVASPAVFAEKASSQASQVIEAPSTEVRSAGDFSSEGAAVLVDVQDVDEVYEYHAELREKRSTSVASLLKESPAEIAAQLNVASSKPAAPAERVAVLTLEPRFPNPPSEEDLDRNIIAGAISDLSTLPEEATRSLTDATEAATVTLSAVEHFSSPDLQLQTLEVTPVFEAHNIEAGAQPESVTEVVLEAVAEVTASKTKLADVHTEKFEGNLESAGIAQPLAADEKATVKPPVIKLASNELPIIERASTPSAKLSHYEETTSHPEKLSTESAFSNALMEAPMTSTHTAPIPEGFDIAAAVPAHPSSEKMVTTLVAVTEGTAENFATAPVVPALTAIQHDIEQPLPGTETAPHLVPAEQSTAVGAANEIPMEKIVTKEAEQQGVAGGSGVACVDSRPLFVENYIQQVAELPTPMELLPEAPFETAERVVLDRPETLPATITKLPVVPETVNFLGVTDQRKLQVQQSVLHGAPRESPQRFQPVLPATIIKLQAVPETSNLLGVAEQEKPQVVQPSVPHGLLCEVPQKLQPALAVQPPAVAGLPEALQETAELPTMSKTAELPVAPKREEAQDAEHCAPSEGPEDILPADYTLEKAPSVKETTEPPQLLPHSEVMPVLQAWPTERKHSEVQEDAPAPLSPNAITEQPEVFEVVVPKSEKGEAEAVGLSTLTAFSKTGMRTTAEEPAATESELAIAEALRVSREEALRREGPEALILEEMTVEVLRPELQQSEAEMTSLQTLARPPTSERDIDQALISGALFPPTEPVAYVDSQESLKAPTGSSITDQASVRLAPNYTTSLPVSEAQLYLEGGEKISATMARALDRAAEEKEEEQIRKLAAAAIAVAEAAAIMETQESQTSMPAEPSMTGSMITAVTEFPVVLAVAKATISQEIREKIADDMEMRPSVSRTALVAVIADEQLQDPEAARDARAPSVTTTSGSVEDPSRVRADETEPTDGLEVPEKLVPVLDDEIHAPMPTSFNVPVINIQYNFHFPASGAPGPSGRQTPPSPEQAMAAQVLQGALAQQRMAGHIPGHHVLTPEQQAVREMTERLNDIAARGTEPYTGRQSPARDTFFQQLPRKFVPPVPPLPPPPRSSASQESRRRFGMRAVVLLLAFLMLVFVMLYALGLLGKKRYFMYYG